MDSRNDRYLDWLPDEILLQILSWLDGKHLARLFLTNKRLHGLALDHSLWRFLFQQLRFGYRLSANETKPHVEFKRAYVREVHFDKAITGIIRNIVADRPANSVDFNRIDYLLSHYNLDAKDLAYLGKYVEEALTYQNSPIRLLTNNRKHLLQYLYHLALKFYTNEKGEIDVHKTDAKGRTILYWALVCKLKPGAIKNLMRLGANPNAYYDNGYGSETLYCLAIKDHRKSISRCLQKFGGEEKRKYSLHLSTAIESGNLSFLKQEIESHPELLNATNQDGNALLVCAVLCGQEKIVAYLIEKMANLNVTYNKPNDTEDGATALILAINRPHCINIAKLLIKSNANLFIATRKDKNQAIHFAANHGLNDIVKLLLEEKEDLLEQKNALDETPLVLAAKEGHSLVVRYLLRQGANSRVATNQPGTLGHRNTAFNWAARNGHTDTVRKLIRGGATKHINISNRSLKSAAEQGLFDVVQLLLETDLIKHNYVGFSEIYPALRIATIKGHEKIVFYLQKRAAIKINVSDSTNDDSTLLHLAVENGHVELSRRLIKAGSLLSARKKLSGMTPIHLAAKYGHLSIAELLIKEDQDSKERLNLLDSLDANGQTPLCHAIANGHKDVVSYLLRNGASLYFLIPDSNHVRKTLLDYALEHGHKEIAAMLIKAGINDVMMQKLVKSCFISAAKQGNLNIFKQLFEINHDINLFSQTALRLAISYRQDNIVEYLISQGTSKSIVEAGLNGRIYCNDSLISAVVNGQLDEVQLMVEAELDQMKYIRQVDEKQVSVFELAVHHGHADIVNYLINKGGHFNCQGENHVNHLTPSLFVAAIYGYNEVIKHLITAGACLHLITREKRYVFQMALQYGHFDTAMLLVELESQQTEKCKKIRFIHIAAEQGDLDAVKMLLQIKPDLLECMNKDGETPLFVAAANGHTNVVHYLISLGAKQDATSSAGMTPIQKAYENGHVNIVSLFSEAERDMEPLFHHNLDDFLLLSDFAEIEMVQDAIKPKKRKREDKPDADESQNKSNEAHKKLAPLAQLSHSKLFKTHHHKKPKVIPAKDFVNLNSRKSGS